MSDWHLARGYRYAGIVSGLRTEPDRWGAVGDEAALVVARQRPDGADVR